MPQLATKLRPDSCHPPPFQLSPFVAAGRPDQEPPPGFWNGPIFATAAGQAVFFATPVVVENGGLQIADSIFGLPFAKGARKLLASAAERFRLHNGYPR